MSPSFLGPREEPGGYMAEHEATFGAGTLDCEQRGLEHTVIAWATDAVKTRGLCQVCRREIVQLHEPEPQP